MSTKDLIRMLSIDDKTITTDLDRAGYRKMGVQVKAAVNFDEARKIMAKDHIDLIVINMDYSLVNALEITKHFKGDADTSETPIVLTSVQTSAKVRNSALDAGADLFVEQPLPRQYFIEKLKQLLEHKTRNTERVNLKSEVKFKFNGKEASCRIGDLSKSGILLATDLELESGTEVTLEFSLSDGKKPLTIKGEVVRTIKYSKNRPEQKSGLGIRFVEFSTPENQNRLERYVDKNSTDDNKMRYYL